MFCAIRIAGWDFIPYKFTKAADITQRPFYLVHCRVAIGAMPLLRRSPFLMIAPSASAPSASAKLFAFARDVIG